MNGSDAETSHLAGTARTTDRDTTVGTDRESAVADLPPSAKLVYKVLEYEGAMTQDGIATESRLCPRTVRYALGKLEECGVVRSRASLRDARQSVYWLAD